MTLGQDSGQSIERRNEEATKIFKMFLGDWENILEQMTDKEKEFVCSLKTYFNYYKKLSVSGKQLFWLRDLMEKYL